MFALISMAFAAETVVYGAGDAASALARVAESAGGVPEGMRAVSVDELMAGRPATMVSGGQLTVCSGAPSSPEAIRQSLGLAEGAIKYMEFGSARAALSATLRDLSCLQVPVDPAVASRAWYLLGIVDAAAGEQAASREDFRRARLFSPTMGWDENFAPNAKATFDAIASEAKTAPLVSLTVLPAPGEGTFRLDGRPVQLVDGHVGVSSGDHYVQVGDSPATTYSLRVDGTTPPTLVLPSLVHSEVLEWAGDGEKRAALSSVLVSALGSEGVVYVVNSQVVWRVRLGGSAWDLVAMGGGPVAPAKPTTTKPTAAKPPPAKAGAPLPTEPVATSPATRKKSPLGPVLMGVGGAAGVGGGVVLLLGELGAREVVNTALANEADHGSYDLTDADRAKYANDAKMVLAGGVVGGVGAALLATGLVVTVAF